jgi:hypothetical protein
MVSHRGIDPNPEKISAIMNMTPPKSLLDVQNITGCMAALSPFISKLSIRGCPSSSYLRSMISFNGSRKHRRPLKNSKGT